MPRNWNIQWSNHNSQRSYPLTDWSSKQDQTGTITLPDSFMVAMLFPIHAALNVLPDRFFIKSVGVYPTGYAVMVGYDDGTNAPPLAAVANVPKDTHVENRVYALAGVDDFADSVGQLAIGRLDDMEQLPPGLYSFDRNGSALEADCIRPMIRGISSITVVNGSDRSDRLYGDIELVAGANFRITVGQGGPSGAQIIFNAISGEGLVEACVCDETGEGPPIRFINGIPPLPDGNFRMVGDDCLSLEPINNGLALHDNCSAPCCGCTELDPLVRQLDRFADGVTTLQNYVNNLGGQVVQMGLVVLGSRVGDQGCYQV